MSLLKDYFEETGARKVIEKDYGFMTYMIDGNECFVEDAYIKPSRRGEGLLKELESEVIEQAKQAGCGIITCSVIPSYATSTSSLQYILSRGYKLLRSESNFIGLYKEL